MYPLCRHGRGVLLRLIFPSRLGTPMEPDNLRRSWGRISKSAGMVNARFHDIRHTCESLLLDLKVPPHIVREIVGHSDIEVTMTIYAHASLDESGPFSGSWGMPSTESLPSKCPGREGGFHWSSQHWWSTCWF